MSSFVLIISAVTTATTALLSIASGMAHHDPHFKPNRTGIVQLFEWKFSDIGRECEEFLGPRGFGGVQVSPVSENVVRKDFERPWWERYHPISYQIISRSGNKVEFEAMSRACNDAGVRVYVDVVLNHMAAPRPDGNAEQGEEGEANEEVAYSELMEGVAGSVANATGRDYPAVPYAESHFHRRCAIVDYTDGHQIRNCELKQLPDLDQSKEYVRAKIVAFLDSLVDMGAAGFRVDAAKYMWPMDIKAIASRIKDLNPEYDFPPESRPFLIQEVIDLGEHAISKTEYTGNGAVTESQHGVQMAAIFNNRQPLSSLINWGPAMGFLLPADSVVFIDTHYTQRGNGLGRHRGPEAVLTHQQPKKYTMATALMLAHPYGTKRIMSSYRFESADQGPPADEDGAITSPEFNEDDGQCLADSQWICEHRWPAIAAMVAFANHVAADGINGFQNAGPNQVTFCRGASGFVALNNDPEEDLERIIYVCVPPGEYCDAISGGLVDGECSGRRVTVNEDRFALVSLPASDPHGVLAIYDGARLGEDK